MSYWPAVFYLPRQGDEAIGVAGAIRKHKAAGRPVYLVLLSSKNSSNLLRILNGQDFCSWHQTYHHYQLTMEQLVQVRNTEFMASAKSLGVDATYIVDERLIPNIDSVSHDASVAHIAAIVRRFETLFPGASHKLISGRMDQWPDGTRDPIHVACWDAALSLRKQISDFCFYRIFTYAHRVSNRRSGFNLPLQTEWLDSKREALSQYKLFDPTARRFACGYHIVPTLIDAAFKDEKEYFDLLP